MLPYLVQNSFLSTSSYIKFAGSKRSLSFRNPLLKSRLSVLGLKSSTFELLFAQSPLSDLERPIHNRFSIS